MASLGRAAVLAVALAGSAGGDAPAELREFRLGAPRSPEQVVTLAHALAWRLAEAGIPGTAEAIPECPEVRVTVHPGAPPDTLRAALTRPFGRLEVRRVVDMLGTEECTAMQGDGQLCLAEPAPPPGEAVALLTEPGFHVESMALQLGADGHSGMPQLVIRLGPAEAELLCALTGESIGRQVALVADGAAITAPHVVEPICGGALALSGTTGGAAGMDELERHAVRIAASMLPPPVILRETLVDRQPATADGPDAAVACADGRAPGSR